MSVPSSQASNAIIYLTYGAFLCVLETRQLDDYGWLTDIEQSHWPGFCVVLETSVEVGVSGKQSHAEGLDPRGSSCHRPATTSTTHVLDAEADLSL